MEDYKKLIKSLYEQVAAIDRNWSSSGHEQRLQALKDQLYELRSFSNPVVQNLSKLSLKFPDEMDQRQFLAILVPIERACNIALSDADLDLLSKDHKQAVGEKNSLIFILDQIRSAFNVGAMVRTADCLNIERMYLCGYTATPEHVKTQKSCMGADAYVDWRWRKTSLEAIQEVKKEGYTVLGLETVADSENILQMQPQGKIAIICGNERYGLDQKTLDECDRVVNLPMFGHKNSLNVSTAMAIAAYACIQS